MGVPEVQAHWRSRREACLLWCPQIYHGVWSQGLRGGRERKAEGPEGQVHEVCGRSHDPLWRPRQRLRVLCLQTRLLRQGVLGIKVKIMLPFDPTGKTGPKKPLPDNVSIVEPKEDTLPPNPFSETKAVKPDQAPGPVV